MREDKEFQIRLDKEILQEIHDKLLAEDHGTVEVIIHDGVVSLHGEVSGRKEKHEVESIVAQVPGIRNIENQLKIKRVENLPHEKIAPEDIEPPIWPSEGGLNQ